MAQPTPVKVAAPKFEDVLKKVQDSFKAVNDEDLKTLVESAPPLIRFQAEQLRLCLHWLGELA